MAYHIDIQHASKEQSPIDDQTITRWATMAIACCQPSAEVTIRLVDIAEITELNTTYRKQNKATNVLAFPMRLPDHIKLDCPLLGDIIICPDILKEESLALNKSLTEHWALMVIHGALHLLGYDHMKADEEAVMQDLEVKLLTQLGFDNPYLEE